MADSDSAPRRGGGGWSRVILWLVIAALLASVWWLASERNERHYRVVAQNGQLVIERGRFFPVGTAASQEKIYFSLPIPAGEKAPGDMEFDDQNSLDRYLFGILGGWAKDAAKKGDTRAAATLVERASALPGLTGAQVTELTAMRADLAWDEAHTDLANAVQLLDAARRKLEIVRQHDGAHAADAGALQTRLQAISGDLAATAGKRPKAE